MMLFQRQAVVAMSRHVMSLSHELGPEYTDVGAKNDCGCMM